MATSPEKREAEALLVLVVTGADTVAGVRDLIYAPLTEQMSEEEWRIARFRRAVLREFDRLIASK